MSGSPTVTQGQWAKPLLLNWARRQAILEIEEVARTLDISAERLKAWESGLEHPDTIALRLLSQLYDCPFSYFFLDSPPVEPVLKDFRGMPPDRRSILSRETKLAFREFRRITRFARMLQEISAVSGELNIGKAHENENPEEVATREAKRFGITKGVRETFASRASAYHVWREAIENLGIFVISLRMSPVECRGAVVIDKPSTAAILLNQNDAVSARIFTLLHEYSHLLLRGNHELVVCDQFPSDTETFSNRFAASVLVPKAEFIKILQDKQINYYQDWWIDSTIKELSDIFYVSRDVIAIRLENLEFAPPGFYAEKRKHWYRTVRPPGFGHTRNKRVNAQEKLGLRLFGLTMKAVQTKLIHPSDAALYMGRIGGSRDKPWFAKAREIEIWSQWYG